MGIFKKDMQQFDYGGMTLWLDLGFQGIEKYLKNGHPNIPYKRPKNGKLTQKEKDYNTKLSRVRALVENMIGGVKRYYYLRHQIRTFCRERIDSFSEVCTGLQNYKLGISLN